MNPIRNIAVNLRAKGPAAVLIVWIVSVTAVGLVGEGPIAERALGLLAIAGGLILGTFAIKAN